MNLRKISFVPLYPGESPGDPELGGWRPLPKRSFRHRTPVVLSQEDALKLVAIRLTWFNLWQSLKIITQRILVETNLLSLKK